MYPTDLISQYSRMATPASTSDAVGRKRKRIVLILSEKIKICELVKNGKSLTSVAKEFDTSKSTVHDIVNTQDKLQTFLTESRTAAVLITGE